MKISFAKRFPDDFNWGAGCASYQWSGCENTNWAWWETSFARQLELKFSGELDTYPLENFICKDACRHDRRYVSDFNKAKEFGFNSLRIGSEPAKIMPKEGVIDKKEIARIVKMAKHLNRIGIKPFWNLWHWTLPLWWENKGGWESPHAVKYFEFYVQAVADALVPLGVTRWITMNEVQRIREIFL
ncbi:MAG: family 1 glycosylhydrolase [Candidatus Paceibacterota bacterium]|jgi:beta-glucosidase